ncbi:MAG: SDR family NAD(P)-dependent oxidoreductase [Alphaproteobacteria bacterium]|uniref:SDR family NAD(P)-dependent oxidoreductase n=1 Tax=Candidatus Nitrobium versatile TaxID=2884831 RepID=A0A953JCG3_9BACT|nr:SDR family NAD(P)-dependent oxidoreductase [Candidatus Nitrobium versatile]
MKALVTGATGFIGSHLVDSLVRQGFDVSCLVRTTSSVRYLEDLNVRLLHGDCRDAASLPPAVQGVDYVFHLAGITKTCSMDEFFAVNVKGTENIMRAVAAHNPGVRRLVYLSSLAAVGPSPDGRPLREDSKAVPVSVYGKTKREGEEIVFRYRNELPLTVIRPPAVYGPRDRDMLVFFKMVKSGIVPYWGKCYYSFIYVEDLVHGIILSSQSEAAVGEAFFLSDRDIHSTDDIVDAISEAMQKRPLRLLVPRAIMPLLGRMSEKMRGTNIINSDKIREMKYSHWVCDSSKAAERLGFEPKVKIREGARWTADWYRIHQWL